MTSQATSYRDAAATERTMNEPQPTATWRDVCAVEDIPADAGCAALFGEHQIAIVRLGEGTDGASFFALDNFDPFSQAPVIARGIVGDKGGIPKIASPIYKQTFDLRTGQCFEDPTVKLRTFPLRVRNGRVEIALPQPS